MSQKLIETVRLAIFGSVPGYHLPSDEKQAQESAA